MLDNHNGGVLRCRANDFDQWVLVLDIGGVLDYIGGGY